ncbi:MAG: hypothetical protein ACJAXY_001818 [Nonlabens sp.]|jgi:hypothetical protein
MHGIGFDMSLQEWFDFDIPETTIAAYYIEDCLNKEIFRSIKTNSKVVYLGNLPLIAPCKKIKKGKEVTYLDLVFHDKTSSFQIEIPEDQGNWLIDQLELLQPTNKISTFSQIKASYESKFNPFEPFWYSEEMEILRANGLLVL